MNPLTTFTLLYTLRCDIACSHCGFSCGPRRTEKMDFREAEGYVEEACAIPGMDMVAYSGGEPFLHYDEILKLMTRAFFRGMSGGIVTNCLWASDDRLAATRIAEMKAAGLVEIITSVDEYHQQHVPFENVRRVAHAAIDAGIRVGINLLKTRNGAFRETDVANRLDLDAEIRNDLRRLWIRESSPLLVGRARARFRADDLYRYGEKELSSNPCHFVIRNAVAAPDGSLFGCCGFGGATGNGPSSLAYAGNLKSHPFHELAKRLEGDLLLNLIATDGPYLLLKLVREREPDVRFREAYVSNCDICEEISGNAALRAAVGRLLRDLAEGGSNATVAGGTG